MFLASLCTVANGQSQAVLSGRVLDDDTRKPLAGANILVREPNIGTVSNDSGYFEIRLQVGNYEIRVSYIGYKTTITPVQLFSDRDVSLEILLQPSALELETVIVEEKSNIEIIPPQQHTLSKRFIRELPTLTPDVYQVIKKLPGVSSNSDKSAEFSVRGSHFDEHLSMIEGVPIEKPFHLKAGSLESISIFNKEMVERIEFYPGGYPARYGWKLSSASNILFRQGSRESFKSTLSFDARIVNLVFEGPLFLRGNWIVGLRKSFNNYWYSKIRPFAHGQGDFSDLQGRIRIDIAPPLWADFIFVYGNSVYDFNPKNKEFVFTFPEGSTKVTTIYNRLNGKESNNFETKLAIAKLTFAPIPSLNINVTSAFYSESDNENSMIIKDAQDIPFGSKSPDYISEETIFKDNELNFERYFFRVDLMHKFKDKLAWLSGIEFMRNLIDEKLQETYSYSELEGSISNTTYDDENNFRQNSLGLFSELSYEPHKDFSIHVGARLQYDNLTRETHVNPTFSFSVKNKNNFTFFGAAGIYHQPPSYTELRSANSNNLIQFKNQNSYQLSFGIQKETQHGGHFKIENYYKYSLNTLPYIFENGRYRYEHDKTGKAYALGSDISISGNLNSEVYGIVSYGYLIAKEKTVGENVNWIPRSTDRRHTVKTGLIHTVKGMSGIKVHFNLTFGLGYPYTPKFLKYNEPTNRYYLENGKKNSGRYPFYRRLDIRWSKTINKLNLNNMIYNGEFYFELLNIWNFRNTLEYKWEYFIPNTVVREPVFLTPRMVGIGIKLSF